MARKANKYSFYSLFRCTILAPDTVCDFTSLPFKDGAYKLVVFDPPHLTRAGDTSWTAIKYGVLIGELVVREEADVKRVAKELYNMQRAKSRGKGVVTS